MKQNSVDAHSFLSHIFHFIKKSEIFLHFISHLSSFSVLVRWKTYLMRIILRLKTFFSRSIVFKDLCWLYRGASLFAFVFYFRKEFILLFILPENKSGCELKLKGDSDKENKNKSLMEKEITMFKFLSKEQKSQIGLQIEYLGHQLIRGKKLVQNFYFFLFFLAYLLLRFLFSYFFTQSFTHSVC